MYKLTGDENTVLYLPQMAFISVNGFGWEDYEAWLAEGNTPEPQYTPAELVEQTLIAAVEKLRTLSLEGGSQVFDIQSRLTTLTYAINGQDPEDPEYIEPTAAEVAELTKRTAQLKAWNTYNLKLGRLPKSAGWPTNPIWPVVPEIYRPENTSAARTASV